MARWPDGVQAAQVEPWFPHHCQQPLSVSSSGEKGTAFGEGERAPSGSPQGGGSERLPVRTSEPLPRAAARRATSRLLASIYF